MYVVSLRCCCAIFACAILGNPSYVRAADAPPPWDFKSKAAIQAKAKYNLAVEEARKQLIQELTEAKNAATMAADLDEAVKIEKSLKVLDIGEDPPRKFKLQSRLKGTRWAWGRKFDNDGKIRLNFSTDTYSMVEPTRTQRGDYIATTPWSVRMDNERDLIFSRDFKRFVLITSEGEIRTGLRLR